MAEKHKPTYIMVPRRLIMAWLVSYIVLFIGVIGSYQYANHTARQLCGLIKTSNDTYLKQPPPSQTGKLMAKEFARIIKNYHCK